MGAIVVTKQGERQVSLPQSTPVIVRYGQVWGRGPELPPTRARVVGFQWRDEPTPFDRGHLDKAYLEAEDGRRWALFVGEDLMPLVDGWTLLEDAPGGLSLADVKAWRAIERKAQAKQRRRAEYEALRMEVEGQ